MCMISTLPAWPKCQGWVVVALPAQGQAHPQQQQHLPPLPAWHHVESSSGVCQPQPVSSAASNSCLQEGPTSTPFFHYICCSWCSRVADYSWPVAMTDCPSHYWPHRIVQQSTGLLKSLIECMVLMNGQRWFESSPWLPKGMLKHYVKVLKTKRKKQWVKKDLRVLSYFGCNVYFLHANRFSFMQYYRLYSSWYHGNDTYDKTPQCSCKWQGLGPKYQVRVSCAVKVQTAKMQPLLGSAQCGVKL